MQLPATPDSMNKVKQHPLEDAHAKVQNKTVCMLREVALCSGRPTAQQSAAEELIELHADIHATRDILVATFQNYRGIVRQVSGPNATGWKSNSEHCEAAVYAVLLRTTQLA